MTYSIIRLIMTFLLTFLFAGAATSCTVPNPDYRPPGGCLSSAECSAPQGVCKLDISMCVQCTTDDSSACGVLTPICGTDNSCRGCTFHRECASNVCRPDGSCSDGNDVAFVAQGGSGSACTQLAPCSSLSTALGIGKPYIKMTGSIADRLTIDSRNVTILADPGARLTGNTPGTIIKVFGSSQVAIFDLEITGGISSQSPRRELGFGIALQPGNTATLSVDRVTLIKNYDGIHSEAGTVNIARSTFDGDGVSASGSGTLNVSESTFLDNDVGIMTENYTGSVSITRTTFSGNDSGVDLQGGTISLSRSTISSCFENGIVIRSGTLGFHIVNNFVVGNRGGGIYVSAAGNGSKIEFNTIVDNQADGNAAGIHCNGKVDSPNNLIFRNGGGAGVGQVSSDCVSRNSLLTTPDNPGFASATDYHLTASSPPSIVNAVDCAGLEDYDGEARPQNGRCDLGADELRP